MRSPMFGDLGTAVAEYLDGYTVEELRMLQRFTSDVNTLVSQATEKLRRAQLGSAPRIAGGIVD